MEHLDTACESPDSQSESFEACQDGSSSRFQTLVCELWKLVCIGAQTPSNGSALRADIAMLLFSGNMFSASLLPLPAEMLLLVEKEVPAVEV